jgi:hypothetical protein
VSRASPARATIAAISSGERGRPRPARRRSTARSNLTMFDDDTLPPYRIDVLAALEAQVAERGADRRGHVGGVQPRAVRPGPDRPRGSYATSGAVRRRRHLPRGPHRRGSRAPADFTDRKLPSGRLAARRRAGSRVPGRPCGESAADALVGPAVVALPLSGRRSSGRR